MFITIGDRNNREQLNVHIVQEPRAIYIHERVPLGFSPDLDKVHSAGQDESVSFCAHYKYYGALCFHIYLQSNLSLKETSQMTPMCGLLR